jgi:hypothetical protein
MKANVGQACLFFILRVKNNINKIQGVVFRKMPIIALDEKGKYIYRTGTCNPSGQKFASCLSEIV